MTAHGLAKISVSDQLNQLNTLLSKGIDKNKTFYTAPLALKDSRAASGFGTGGGHAYRDGSFIVVGPKNGNLSDDGIKYVIVNDAYYNIIDDLSRKFAHVEFIKADVAAERFEQIYKLV
ncbi:MAG: hypothetical protein MZV64_26490 [Ignavibacteriales bacterium]|nr:hypothetical protein [Ignavibacteriales bacterium]